MDLKERLLYTLSKHNMIEKGDKVILGVSGGPDSICLLHLMCRVKRELDISLFVVHLDHMFRGEESREDAQFVRQLSQKWNVPFFEKRVNVPDYIRKTGFSPEDAARRLRYDFFSDIKGKIGANRVATGHNRNDHEETVLMNILRGSGLDGLLGIEPVREFYIRPLIEISRKEIETYLEKKEIPFRIDSTNLTSEYFRNSIRLELIPLIQEKYCSHLGASLRRLSEIARRDLDFIERETKKAFDDGVKAKDEKVYIDIAKFSSLHETIKYRLLREAVGYLCGNIKDFEYRHTKILAEFIQEALVGSLIDLPKGLSGEKGYEYFVISREGFRQTADYSFNLSVPGQMAIEETGVVITAYIKSRESDLILKTNPNVAQVDYDKIKSHLIVRNRRKGDRFIPLGANGYKKLKDFFIDEKVPRRNRNDVPIIETDNQIVWVAGMRIDDRFKITPSTRNILVLSLN